MRPKRRERRIFVAIMDCKKNGRGGGGYVAGSGTPSRWKGGGRETPDPPFYLCPHQAEMDQNDVLWFL